MADDHKTVLLSIFATLLVAAIVLVATVVVSGGIDITLIKSYVLPLVLSAFTLLVFAGFLVAHQKGKIPGFSPPAPAKEEKAPDA